MLHSLNITKGYNSIDLDIDLEDNLCQFDVEVDTMDGTENAQIPVSKEQAKELIISLQLFVDN